MHCEKVQNFLEKKIGNNLVVMKKAVPLHPQTGNDPGAKKRSLEQLKERQ